MTKERLKKAHSSNQLPSTWSVGVFHSRNRADPHPPLARTLSKTNTTDPEADKIAIEIVLPARYSSWRRGEDRKAKTTGDVPVIILVKLNIQLASARILGGFWVARHPRSADEVVSPCREGKLELSDTSEISIQDNTSG